MEWTPRNSVKNTNVDNRVADNLVNRVSARDHVMLGVMAITCLALTYVLSALL